MDKYRGKYKKCRTCVHAVEPMMELVIVKESCPEKWENKSTGTMFSDKHRCEACEHYEAMPWGCENA